MLSVVSESNQPIHIVIDESNGKYFLSYNQQRRQRPINTSQSPPPHSDQISKSTSGYSLNESSSSLTNSSKSSLSSDELRNYAKRENKFDTLTDLVVFYSENRIQIANKMGNDILRTPAFIV